MFYVISSVAVISILVGTEILEVKYLLNYLKQVFSSLISLMWQHLVVGDSA